MTEADPEIFTADYTGQPGERTFFLQSRAGTQTQSFLCEKEQVQVLAEKVREILLLLDTNDAIGSAPPARDPAYGLEAPIEPEWRVGTMGLGYDEDRDRIVISMQPVSEQDEEAEPEPEVEEFAIRFSLRRDQARSFVLHALAVIGEGRPLCQFCGLPMGPGEHKCPAMNGHRLT